MNREQKETDLKYQKTRDNIEIIKWLLVAIALLSFGNLVL